MKGSNEKLFGGLGTAEEERPPQPPVRHRTGTYLGERESHLAQLTRGEMVEKALYWVDPIRSRMWEHHNRRYELLNEERCADLIQAFKAQGKQEFPAIVRELKGEKEFDYEVVCGARRHFTVSWLRAHNYPQFKFLIEVRDLTDEEAFRLSDTENRDREDISDYERAVDYHHAIKQYYRTQKDMAERLEVSQSWLSEYLDVAELPKEVVAAYPDVTAIRVGHAKTLKPLLKDRNLRQRILAKAKTVKADQDARRKADENLLDGQAVVRELTSVRGSKSSQSAEPLVVFESRAGKKMLEVTRKKRALVLTVPVGSGAQPEEILTACRAAITDHFS